MRKLVGRNEENSDSKKKQIVLLKFDFVDCLRLLTNNFQSDISFFIYV